MIKFPNCKINIGLNILSKREDGFHNLQTVFYPIAVYEAIEVVEGDNTNLPILFTQSGIEFPHDRTENICVKAYQLLKIDFPQLPPVKMHLHKAIPVGAGMGGGSADGAFTLKLLNDKFGLGLSTDQLKNYAGNLGSDCAFFVMNQPCFATGKGEILEPLTLDLSAFDILLINPGIHVSTAVAFSHIEPGKNQVDLKEWIYSPVENWKANIVNDFEESVFKLYPAIRAIKADLYDKGALFASMTGSGSTVYGIFNKESRPEINYPPHYFIRWI
jgi:4-diphosphocytidyl-2-C-methyl-D-erythritol kinase